MSPTSNGKRWGAVFGMAVFTAVLLVAGPEESWAQPAGWTYQVFQMKDGKPSAVLVQAATGAEVVLHTGDRLEGYEVLTVNTDRVVFRNKELVASLLKGRSGKKGGLEYRVANLRAEKTAVRQLLSDLCRMSGLELVVMGRVEGHVSVDFSGSTVREILDTLCEYASLAYMAESGKLIVMPKEELDKIKRL